MLRNIATFTAGHGWHHRIAAAALMLALAIGAASLARPAAAQQVWLERGELVTHLADQFAENPVAIGIAANGAVLELFTAPDGSTWTIVMTMPNGLSTIVATGEHWIAVPPPAKGLVS